MDDNLINANGINGVDIRMTDSLLPAVGTPALISNNVISGHLSGDGFRLINPDTNGTEFGIDFVDNTISDNTGGAGINIALNAESGGLTTTLTGNEISNNGNVGNAGSRGASFELNDDATLNLAFGDSAANANVLEGNFDVGIAVVTQSTAQATVVIENTMVSGTSDGANAAFDGDGIAVHSSGDSVVTSLTIGDEMLSNTQSMGNAGNGIDLELSEERAQSERPHSERRVEWKRRARNRHHPDWLLLVE